ncbi:PilZ domain-containing protein [Roseibium algae]|uniref:PilZ domain-containing protein n=1 Tax=Roseibium algae TaxID=3123038 RepID=A0ABU8TNC5_9HYPH
MSESPEHTENRRCNERRRTLKAARIVFAGLTQVFNCTIRNASDTGALLVLPSSIGVPNSFLLYVDNESTRRPAEVIWRREDRMGVRYTGPAESTIKKLS